MTLLYLVRHGQTEWSKSGQHTSYTDLDLTPEGEEQARALRPRLDPSEFGLVLSSPRLRARRTAELAGFSNYVVTDDLQEWNYGDYEGKTSAEIRANYHPGWRLWFNGVPGGETADEVRQRLTRVVRLVRSSGVDKAICFGHGHASRVLALCWMDFPLIFGQAFPVETASLSILGREKESWAMLRWNS
ncbi:histidine phosphatase family protein [Propionimicrobium sp. PCR01-08-3]|uniref:histidine phosphatase family protein n=1 Tax=Propionimicrobium sp. PCR01-08-3 TaxID=3052086 RepID=UPI00255CF8F0|nr:histidine phosphatase family protein [Propionimicrobium sp. PCR01-08-3]WIY82441.1 histidine phosphatase family protein [Propionimicrobium sp. PCR01-08-3]